jgi:hypothetical protein
MPAEQRKRHGFTQRQIQAVYVVILQKHKRFCCHGPDQVRMVATDVTLFCHTCCIRQKAIVEAMIIPVQDTTNSHIIQAVLCKAAIGDTSFHDLL